jgi:hypothetical protein
LGRVPKEDWGGETKTLPEGFRFFERKDMRLIGFILLVVGLLAYSMVGTSGKVDEIKKKAPSEMAPRNWKILRYEGFEYGSWGNHGGKVWYHVANIDDPSIQYRVFITMWNGELQYHYGAPETLNRIDVKARVD